MEDYLDDDFDTTMKVIVVGNGRVGKTSLVRQFATGKYDENYKQTIGVSFTEKKMFVKEIEQNITFMLWDTAGQEEFAEMTKQYYRGAKACVLAFSTTDRASFEAIEKWNEKVLHECEEGICRVLIQNKIDLFSERVIEDSEAESLAERLQVKFFKASVKNNFNVDAIFTHLAVQYMELKNLQKQQQEQLLAQRKKEQQAKTGKKRNRNSTRGSLQQANNGDFTDRPFNLEKASRRVDQTKNRFWNPNCC
jgi:Ras-related protein Rab-23